MKKIFLVASIALLTVGAFAQSTSPRFSNPPRDNTGRNLTFESYTRVYVAADTINPKASNTYYTFSTLTGARTVAVGVKSSYKYDKVTMIFTSDGTGRTVTFGTNFVPYATTLVLVASKQATVEFIFDGAKYVELARTIQQ